MTTGCTKAFNTSGCQLPGCHYASYRPWVVQKKNKGDACKDTIGSVDRVVGGWEATRRKDTVSLLRPRGLVLASASASCVNQTNASKQQI